LTDRSKRRKINEILEREEGIAIAEGASLEFVQKITGFDMETLKNLL